MTAKDKAQELVNKFAKIQQQIDWTKDKQLMELCGERNDALGQEGEYYWNELAKQSALIAVDEIISFMHCSESHIWTKVKRQIEKL
jgi:ribosomal 30S subunit maturation factor RimM